MAMKEYSAFPNAPASLKPHYQIALCHIQDTRDGGVSYPAAEVQSVYSTARGDWATRTLIGWVFYLSSEVQSVYFAAPGDWGTRTLIGAGFLPLFTGAVGVYTAPAD